MLSILLAKLFKRMIDQFDRLRKRNAFVEQYKKEKMFENGLEEFDDARYIFGQSPYPLTNRVISQGDSRGTAERIQSVRESRLHHIRESLVLLRG